MLYCAFNNSPFFIEKDLQFFIPSHFFFCPGPPIIFLIFVLQNVAKLVLHFTFTAISICPGNKSWSIYELPPDWALFLPGFHFGFELKNNYCVIINI